MKTIEEKAKAYDEALEQAQKELATCGSMDCDAARQIFRLFPQLRESEDEKVWQWIREHINHDGTNMFDKAVDWLERQKEHKPIEFKNDELVEIIKGEFEGFRRLLKKKGIDYEPQYGYWEGFARLFDSSAREYVKEQKEQKPTPDWMPKFLDELRSKKHYFDWDEHREIEGQILAIINWIAPNYFEEKEQKSAEKQDYSGLNDLERAIHRGFLSAGVENVSITIIKETAWECLAQMNPAEWNDTDMKEARDSLISVCRDWEYGKQTTLIPLAAVRARYFLEHLNEPKPAEWSEEDEYCKQQLIAFCENCMQQDANAIRCADWLKSLRPQPKQEWSDKDKNIFNLALDLIKHSDDCDGILDQELAVKWFAELPSRFVPQPNQEWSEEDDVMFKTAKKIIWESEASDGTTNKVISWLENRFKSLRPQPKQEWSEEDERILKGIIGKIDHDQTYGVPKAEMLSFLKRHRPSRKLSEDQIYTLERICSNLHLRASDDAPKLDEIIELLKRK